MTTYILDTNVILRFFVDDHSEHQEQAVRWFKQAESGSISIIVDPVIIAEVSFVLESFYRYSRSRIADTLEVFLSQRWLDVRDRESLLGLWQYYRDGLHFVDSYCISRAKNANAAVLSFDKKLTKRSR